MSFDEQLPDVLDQFLRMGLRRITLVHGPVLAYQEFREIPFDRFAAQQPGCCMFQVLEQRMRAVAIHCDFLE